MVCQKSERCSPQRRHLWCISKALGNVPAGGHGHGQWCVTAPLVTSWHGFGQDDIALSQLPPSKGQGTSMVQRLCQA